MVTSTESSATRQWTDAQLKAINTTGTSLLVSAAAGSGKTSVLAERCVHLLCDASPACEVGELLVVTFTEAAAAEMKARIAKSLALRHSAKPTETTARHLAMLDRATIGTLHSFCAGVLRQNFHLLGIDPEFRILDEAEAELLRLDIARELFDARYDDPEAADFRSLIDCYGDGKDERLIRQVIDTYETLCSVVNPVQWLREARDRINAAIDLPMDQSELGKAYHKIISSDLKSILRECEAAANVIKSLRNFNDYITHLRALYAILKKWQGAFEKGGIDALARAVDSTELPPTPRMSNSIEGKELAKSRVDAIRRAMKFGSWRKNLMFTTEQWKEGLNQTLPHVDVFLALVSEFSEKYTEAKDEQGVLDFADLEGLALRCLRSDASEEIAPSAVARRFHQQYKHVLVDEYQDINGVQDAILSLVSRECLGTDTNLFCVGDVKQSIYRFRLAEPKQFLDRRDKYNQTGSNGQVIDLQTNFRSRAPLLAAINVVFEKLMTKDAADLDYDQSQELKPGQKFPELANGFHGSPIELHLLPREAPGAAAAETEDGDEPLDRSEREAALLGQRILEMVGQREKPAMQIVDRSGPEPASRPIRFGDIVLLLRSLRFKADQFAAVLRGMGIPVHAESATGYFEATEVNDVLSLLHVLDNQRQDIHLAALLRSPLSQLQNAESNLAHIRLAYGGQPTVPFHLAVQKYADEQTDKLAGFLRKIREKLEKWRQEVRQQPVAEMLWSIYEQTGYLAYVAGLNNGPQREANLIELHDRARQFGTFQRQGLGRFLTFLEKLKKESDLGQASIASEADDVVRIMSIHRSKGQEFPVVLLPDLGKAINMQDAQGTILLDRAAGLGLQVVDETLQVRHPSLASTVVQQRLRQQTLAEELRVLYVAMTRAKEHLIMVGTCADTLPERWRQQWSNFSGKIPAETVLAARCPLDWLGPVAAIAPDQIQLNMRTLEEVSAWSANQPVAGKLSTAQSAIAHLQPLSPAPQMSAETQAVIDRLGWKYPHQSIADLAATASVTSLVKKAAVTASDAALPSRSLDRVLTQPAFLAGRLPVDAADIGTATHAVLEHFDFSRADEPGTIDRQIQHLVETRRLTQELSAIVDRPAIQWFLSSDIGRMLRQQSGGLKRELPVYYANPSDATNADPMDRQMIRGRIDLLAPDNGGWMIVDYKTDRVEGESLEERAALYAGQLEIYRKAIRKMTGNANVSAVLVFLHPREIRRVD